MRPPIGDRIARGLERVATIAQGANDSDGDVGDPGDHPYNAEWENEPGRGDYAEASEDVKAAIRYCRELARWYLDGEGV